jgi:hypothetical protein
MATAIDNELTHAAFPNAHDVLRAAFDGAIRHVLEHMQDGALRTVVLAELRLAYRRAVERLN